MKYRKSAARNRLWRVLDIAETQICGKMVTFETPEIVMAETCGTLAFQRTPAQGVSERRLTAPSTSASTAGNAALLVLPLARRLARHHAPCFEHSVYLLD